MPPRVTVIIPTYNWSTVLPYSIGTVLEQTFRDFELLVIGDGCTDDSEQVVRAISDERVSWIAIPRTGHQSGPNNEGLRRAGGEIIAYLGHDDLWLPHHLAVHVAAIDAGADVSCSLVAFVGPEGSYVEVPRPDLQRASFVIPSGFVHRASVTAGIGGWRDFREIAAHPEADLILRATAAGSSMRLLPRLTAVKFPAAIRKDVYRTRPHHEQAAWLQRIRSEPDLEAAILGQVIAQPTQRTTGLASRVWRMLRDPSRWMSYFFPGKGAAIRAWQRYKGVDDARRRTER
jgi:glycosyltransferase involved in cell wall biosynthesis